MGSLVILHIVQAIARLVVIGVVSSTAQKTVAILTTGQVIIASQPHQKITTGIAKEPVITVQCRVQFG